MAGFSRTNLIGKELGSVPGKPAKKGQPLKGLLIISTNTLLHLTILYLNRDCKCGKDS